MPCISDQEWVATSTEFLALGVPGATWEKFPDIGSKRCCGPQVTLQMVVSLSRDALIDRPEPVPCQPPV